MSALGITILTLVAALGTGLNAGIFFAFSSFIMRALADRPAPEGIAAMQAINVKVLNVSFLGTFLGTALLCLVITALAVLDWGQPGDLLRVIGSGAYLIGTFGVTIACNVPRNNTLAKLEPTGPDAESAWRSYGRAWTTWNTVRTLAALLATAAFIGSIV